MRIVFIIVKYQNVKHDFYFFLDFKFQRIIKQCFIKSLFFPDFKILEITMIQGLNAKKKRSEISKLLKN